jgi:hypothetical protein
MENLNILHSKIEKILQDYKKKAPIIEKSKFAGTARESKKYFDGKEREDLIMLFGTRGCRWYLESGGCFMCSFNVGESFREYSSKDIINQVKQIVKDHDLKKMEGVFICPYSSFDTLEMPKEAREFIYNLLNQYKNILYVAFQSRAEFVVDSILKEIKEKLADKKLYVFIGLESSNDFITRYCIHKGYGFKEVKERVQLLKKYGVHPGVFLLLKPPFLAEKEAINDAIKSIKDCFRIGVEDIYLMCNRIGGYSITDSLYKMKKYRAPWLWSIIEVLKNFDGEELKKIKISGFRVSIITLDDPHNCKICNEGVMNAIEKFNRTKSISAFDKLDCECKKEWEEELKRRYLPLKTRIIEDYKELISFMEN